MRNLRLNFLASLLIACSMMYVSCEKEEEENEEVVCVSCTDSTNTGGGTDTTNTGGGTDSTNTGGGGDTTVVDSTNTGGGGGTTTIDSTNTGGGVEQPQLTLLILEEVIPRIIFFVQFVQTNIF